MSDKSAKWAKCIIPLVLFVIGSAFIYVQEVHASDEVLSRQLLSSVHHKDLFPLNERDYWGFLFVGIGTMIAASGGIGGGGILVPLLILVFDFHPKYAIPLSNFTILGSSITNMAMNLDKRHPDANRPLVDWDLILVMEPLTMAGAVVGAFIGKVLPDWLLVIALVILLAFTTKTTLEKGIQQFRKETQAFADAKRSELSKATIEMTESAETRGLLSDEADDEEGRDQDDISSHSKNFHHTDNHSELEVLLDAEKSTPMDKVVILSVMVLVVIVLNLVKGGGGSFPSPLGIACGSTTYWLVTAFVFVWVLGISFWMRSLLIEKWKLKKRINYKYAPGDIEWNEVNTIYYPCICFFAGFFAGMFGVGGGIVKGPLMLYMGVHPLVASGTCAVMIMFTSVAACAMFIAFGTLTWDYAIFLFILGLITTVIGQFGVSYLVDKYKRYSFVSLSIGAVVAISTLLMALQSIFSLIEAQQNGGSQTSSVCGNK